MIRLLTSLACGSGGGWDARPGVIGHTASE
jgi:hypothetical protein